MKIIQGLFLCSLFVGSSSFSADERKEGEEAIGHGVKSTLAVESSCWCKPKNVLHVTQMGANLLAIAAQLPMDKETKKYMKVAGKGIRAAVDLMGVAQEYKKEISAAENKKTGDVAVVGSDLAINGNTHLVKVALDKVGLGRHARVVGAIENIARRLGRDLMLDSYQAKKVTKKGKTTFVSNYPNEVRSALFAAELVSLITQKGEISLSQDKEVITVSRGGKTLSFKAMKFQGNRTLADFINDVKDVAHVTTALANAIANR